MTSNTKVFTDNTWYELLRNRNPNKKLLKHETTCTCCNTHGHHCTVCHLLPSEPEVKEECVEQMIRSQRINTHEKCPATNHPTKNVKLFLKFGKHLNKTNPYRDSTTYENKLRSKPGHWKALGAPKSVTSWIGYGIQIRTAINVPKAKLTNHRSAQENVDDVIADHKKAVDRHWFAPVSETKRTSKCPYK